MYRVRILGAGTRELTRLEKPLARRIIERITWLAMNPDIISHEALTRELAGFYELRVGDYRVVYEILHAEQMLVIHTIGHRRDIGGGKKSGGKYRPLPLSTGAPPARTSHGPP